MDNRRTLTKLLRTQNFNGFHRRMTDAENYACAIANIENVVAVVSDLVKGTSRIYDGGFGDIIGLKDYIHENSIWETRILSMMSESEQEEKYIAELRFFHYLRHMSKSCRNNYYLVAKLRFNIGAGEYLDILHRMYYIYDDDMENVIGAICLYGPLSFDIKGKSHAINSLTGLAEPLTTSTNNTVLSNRERQILSLIESGLQSTQIADRLNISKHTVSRHRQEILSKLQVKNSIEACRLAKSMELI